MKLILHRRPRGFTLVELMAVITIIVILAGVVVAGLGYVNEKQASAKAKVQIALLGKALEEYKVDFGNYPSTANIANATKPKGTETSAKSLYQVLFKDGLTYTSSASPPANWILATKIYISDLDPRYSKQGWVAKPTSTTALPLDNLVVTDPWGNEYCYRSAKGVPPATGTTPTNAATINPDFDLWSMGKDGLTGTPATEADDIKN